MGVLLDTSYLLRLFAIEVEGIDWDRIHDLLESEAPSASEVQALELLITGRKFLRKGELGPADIVRGMKGFRAMEIIPLSPKIAEASLDLFPLLRDPFDTVILATAATEGHTLITLDSNLLSAARSPRLGRRQLGFKALSL